MRQSHAAFVIVSIALNGCSGDRPLPRTEAAATPRLQEEVALGNIASRARLAFRPRDGKFVGAGSTYQVVAESGGALSFQPARQAPDRTVLHGAPLSLRTASISRGGGPVASADARISVATDGSLTLDRGAVQEDVRNGNDGAEQSWQFERAPAGSGDLEVRIQVGGQELVEESPSGLHFRDPKSGLGTRYGRGTWVDSKGVSTPVRPRWEQGFIVLSLPASLLDRSSYPAVLDPVIQAEAGTDAPIIGPSSGFADHPQLAGDGTNYLVVWEEGRGVDEEAILATRVRAADGAVLDTVDIVIDGGSPVLFGKTSPHVAFDGTNFLVVWLDSKQDPNSGVHKVYGSFVTPAGVPGAPFLISSPASNAQSVSLAWNGTRYLVAWSDKRSDLGDVYAIRVSTSGTVEDLNELQIAVNAGNQSDPTVASNGLEFLVAWADDRTTPGVPDIWSTRVSTLGNIDFLPQQVANSPAHETFPTAAWNGVNYLVAWVHDQNLGPDLHATEVSPLSGAPLPQNGFVVYAGVDKVVSPQAARVGNKVVVAWRSQLGLHHLMAIPITGAVPGAAVDYGPAALFRGPAIAADNLGAAVVYTENNVYRATLQRLNADLSTNGASFHLGQSAPTQLYPIVAASGTNYLVVWNETGAISSLRALLVDPNGNPQGGVMTLAAAGVSATLPSVAWDPTSSNYLVTWVDGTNPNQTSVKGNRVSKSGLILDGPGFLIDPGDPFAPTEISSACGPTNCLLVGVFNVEIRATLVGNGVVLGPPMVISNQNSTLPLSSVAFSGSHYLIAWTDKRNGDFDIFGARITTTGVDLDPGGFLIDNGPSNQLYPSVSPGPFADQFYVAWEDIRLAVPNQGTVGVVRVDGGNPAPASALSLISSSGYLRYVSAAFDGASLVLTWSTLTAPGQIRVARLDPNLALREPPMMGAQGNSFNASAPVASAGQQRSLFTYARLDANSATYRVYSRLLRLADNGTPCVDQTECNSGSCFDGVCCDTPCTPGFNHVGPTTCLGNTPGTCQVLGCDPGFLDCLGGWGNGCETPVDVANCGTCGATCNPINAADESCFPMPGLCSYTCNPGFQDCNPSPFNFDGCETDTKVDGNCGGCGVTCAGNACETASCKVVAGDGVCQTVSSAACGTPFCGLPNGACVTWLDSDGDGLSDDWETNGYADLNCNGQNDGPALDIPLPGANKSVKDVYVRYDYMDNGNHDHKPPAAALAQVVTAFAAHNINLHFVAPSGPIPETQVLTLDPNPNVACAGGDFSTMQGLRAAHLGVLGPAYHYMVFAHNATCADAVHCNACPTDALCPGAKPDPTATGIADLPGDDVIISFGFRIDNGFPIGIELWASTIMHELGHNLGLKHGGDDACINNKPNYISVMNYAYQLNGIVVADGPGSTNFLTCASEADCGPPNVSTGACATAGACHCTDDQTANLGSEICYRVDYASANLLSLNESNLNETVGVGGAPASVDLVFYDVPGGAQLLGASNGSAIDWNNMGGNQQTNVLADINGDGGPTNLTTQQDWSNLTLAYQCTPGYGAGSPASWSTAEITHDQAVQNHTLYPTRQVSIDIRPGCSSNWIILGSGQTVQVALFGSATFDVTRVDLPTIRFAGAAPTHVAAADPNGDGHGDLIFDFTMSSLQLDPTSTSAAFAGSLVSSQSIFARQPVTILDAPGPIVHLADDGSGFAKTLGPPFDRSLVTLSLSDCVASATDLCGNPLPMPASGHIARITSDELPGKKGEPEIAILSPTSFQVRRDRTGGGDGRVYGVVFDVTDGGGNSTEARCRIQVPPRPRAVAVDSGVAVCIGSGC